ncbi:MAG: hypothetical protein O6909_09615 [Alphaproteobacteria bacterium]|nr:hypothetical protein [Alphaproteobacteria bacterium]
MPSPQRNLDLDAALRDARAAYVAAHLESRKFFEAAQSVMPGGKPTFSHERRLCAGKRTLGIDPLNFGFVP